MTKLHSFFIKPFSAKGVLWGSVDLLVKALTLFVWVYLVCILGSLIWQSIKLDYNPVTQLWWFSYSFIMLFGGSLLAYILLFVRDYHDYEYEEDQDSAA
ncbi:MAG: hypothetical protein IKJ44_06255 [Elusimicrobiaceae bacterium]|nr:hypothetical protein [Elusimicrobiaceae bacterium]MBR3899855.1 hypothetical protein [Elusimicrobiaceae bacterium]